MDTVSEKKWFVYIGDRHEGPLSIEEMQGKMVDGRVTPESYVWAEGMPDWKIMNEVEALGPLIQAQVFQHVSAPEIPILDSHESRGVKPADAGPTVNIVSITAEADKTGDMNVSEIRQISESIPAKKPPLFRRFLKFVAALVLIGAMGVLGKMFLLDSSVNLLEGKAKLEEITETLRPHLVKWSEKIPALAAWVSPIPPISDVSIEEYEELKSAARTPFEKGGASIAIAISQSEPLFPTFYLSSNLPEGTQFHIYIIGVGETLLNQLSFTTETDATLSKRLAKTIPVRYSDGKAIPRGEYNVYIALSEVQPQTANAQLNSIPSILPALPLELPKNAKVIGKKLMFLGGNKDATYFARLKEFHNKLQMKATNELNEVKQFAVTLESQLESTKMKFALLRKGSKITAKQKKDWLAFHADWIKLESQLDQIFSKWTPEALEKEYFYGVLYGIIQQTGIELDKVHSFHNSYFNSVQDLKTFEIQLGAALSAAEASLTLLKAKAEQAKNLQANSKGLPKREGL